VKVFRRYGIFLSVTCLTVNVCGASRVITSATDGNWNDPASWVEKASGRHTVPTRSDTVVIGGHTIIMTSEEQVSGFHLTGGTLDLGSYNLISEGESRWGQGVITGNGGFVNQGTLFLQDRPIKTLQGLFNNYSSVTHVDLGDLHIDFGSRWVNRPGSTYDLQSDANITGLKRWDATPRFVNEGLFRKSGGSATSRVEIVFRNMSGTIEVDTGTLMLAGTGGAGSMSSNGIFLVAREATLDLGGGNVNVFNGTYTGDGEGTILFNGGILRAATDFAPTTFRFTRGGFRWNGGTIAAELNEFVNEGLVELNGATVKNIGAGPGFRNRGMVIHRGAGQLNIEYGSSWKNDYGATYDLQSDVSLSAAGGAGPVPTFENSGMFRKSAGPGIATVNSAFLNAGSVEVGSGMLNFAESFVQVSGATRLSGGELSVSSTLDLQGGSLSGAGRVFAAVVNGGHLAPGSSPGVMDITGNFSQGPKGVLEIEIGGRTPDTEYDQLLVRGQAHLAGTLRVRLLNDFVPEIGDSFLVMLNTRINGTFTATDFPPLPAGRQWRLQYDPGAGVRLEVVAR
jgi:hypothetical protein